MFTLDWPAIENAEQRIARAAIVEAVPRVTTLKARVGWSVEV
jgi:hypothetical protein